MATDTKQTVLVIEDNEDNMVLITMLLQNSGYETVWADTGLKGVQLTRESRPDFVLLDIQLPDIELKFPVNFYSSHPCYLKQPCVKAF